MPGDQALCIFDVQVVASKIGPEDLWKLEFPQSFDIPSKTSSFDYGTRRSVHNSTHDIGQTERGDNGIYLSNHRENSPAQKETRSRQNSANATQNNQQSVRKQVRSNSAFIRLTFDDNNY